jgi:hypothetical protein
VNMACTCDGNLQVILIVLIECHQMVLALVRIGDGTSVDR